MQHFTLVAGDKGGLRFHLARLVPLNNRHVPGVKTEAGTSARRAKRENDVAMDVDDGSADEDEDGVAKRSVDPSLWPKPIKLNRRNEAKMRREAEQAAAAATAATLSAVKNEDGTPVAGPSTSVAGQPDPAQPARRGRWGKDPKSRQVYETEADLARRKVAREERDPWLLEAGSERWLGRLEGAADAKTARLAAQQGTGDSKTSYCYFVMDESDFKVYPVDRAYRFVERVNVRPTVTADEAEAEYQKLQTTKQPDRWAKHTAAIRREAGEDPAPPPARAAPARAFGRLGGLRGLPSPVRQPGSRFRAVDDGGRRAGSDDERGGGGGRPEVEEYDEMDYEDEFQDDEEGANNVADDVNDAEETKQAEAAIKRDQLTSIRGGEEIDDEHEDEDGDRLDSAGRRARRLLRKHEQRDEYESDDAESNPYASEVRRRRKSDVFELMARQREATSDVDEVPSPASAGSRAGGNDSRRTSRAGSALPNRPSAAEVAKRATATPGSAASRKQRKSGKRKAGDDTPGAHANGKRARTASLPPVSPPASTPGSPSAPSPAASTSASTPLAQLPLPPGVEDAIIAFLRANGPQPTVKVLKHLKAKVFKADFKQYTDSIRSSLAAIADSSDGVFTLKSDLR